MIGRRILLDIEFVETSVLVLCVSHKIWLKILGMFNLPIFQLSAEPVPSYMYGFSGLLVELSLVQ